MAGLVCVKKKRVRKGPLQTFFWGKNNGHQTGLKLKKNYHREEATSSGKIRTNKKKKKTEEEERDDLIVRGGERK